MSNEGEHLDSMEELYDVNGYFYVTFYNKEGDRITGRKEYEFALK